MLDSGERLGPYEITSPLGAGGMGEVYKACDSRLDRIVAIKVLPEQLSTDPARRERFEREARAVSSLNHPHICTLHDVGEHKGVHYLVMEYLEGETLADRLKKGALPFERALDVAAQIADALDKAHRAGIVHRDLKPGNIMLTKAGVKLLDFGLAKTREKPMAPTEDSEQPTQNKPLTDAGTILGTVQYMAPEQLEGKEVDARADLFSLGAVLYEMLTGRKAFEGSSQASLISAIMSTEPPPVSERQPMTPPVLDRLVRTCLAKDPDLRWQSAADVIRALELVHTTRGTAEGDTKRERRARAWLVPAVVAMTIAAAAALGFFRKAPSETTAVTRLVIPVPENEELYGNAVGRHLAVSPDGRHIVYGTQSASSSRLFVRSLDSFESRIIPGSENVQSPFFSPDGRSIGLLKPDAASIVSVALDGAGPPRTICEDCAFIQRGGVAPYGGTWTRDGDIIYGPGLDGWGLMQVSAEGGTPRSLTVPDEGTYHSAPQALADGRTLLFTLTEASGQRHPALLDLRSGQWDVLPVDGIDIFSYAPSGHLIWVSASSSIMAAPLSLDERRMLGAAVPVVDNVYSGFGSKFAVSDAGTLAYLPSSLMNRRLLRVGRDGRASTAVDEARNFDHPRLSPDGARLAVDIRGGNQPSVWVFDLSRGSQTRMTFQENFFFPCWRADGQALFFAGWNEPGLYFTEVDGSGAVVRFLGLEKFEGVQLQPRVTSHHARGHALMVGYQEDWDIWWVPTGEEPEKLVATPFTETGGVISLDGRYLAYSSNQSGRFEVYVLELGGARRFTASTQGGSEPIWSADGSELFYRRGLEDGTTQLLTVPVRTTPSFEAGEPRLLFEGNYNMSGAGDQHYAAFPDGQSFIMMDASSAGGDLHVVINWFEELKRLAPAE